MTLKEKVDRDIKSAMKSRDQATLRAVRAVKAALLLAERDGSGKPIDQQREIRILQKLLKQRQDSLDIYREQNREDLARKEEEEIEVIGKYLPEQLSEDELAEIIRNVISQTGASSIKEMGKVMGMAVARVEGRADNKAIAKKVRELLSDD